MPEEYVYQKPDTEVKPKKSHKKLIIISATILFVMVLVSAYYFVYQSSPTTTPEKVMAFMDNLMSNKMMVSNYTQAEVSYAITNPQQFSSSDLINYTQASVLYGMNHSLFAMKGIFNSQFSKEFSDVDGISAPTYVTLFVSSMAMTYTFDNGLLSVCQSQENFTEADKRDCLVSVLEAQKVALSSYYNLNYDGDIASCVSMLKKGGISSDINYAGPQDANYFASQNARYAALGDVKLSQICQKMIGYRKLMLQDVKESEIDSNQKFCIVSSMYLMDNYIGNVGATRPTSGIFRIFKESMRDSRYVNLFPSS